MAGDHAFTWLITVLASALSSPGLLCCLAMSLRCAALLYLWVRPQPASSGGFSSPLWFPPFTMGSPLRGRGSFVLDRNKGLESPFGSVVLVSFLFCATDGCRWCCALSPCGCASNLCLRLLFAPCHYGCVSRWSSLRMRVFGCP